MKILLLNQTFYPDNLATSQQVTDLAVFLVEQGHDVSVLAGNRGYENRSRIYSAFENYLGIKIHRVRSTGFGKQRFVLRLLDALTFDLMLTLNLLFFRSQDVVVSFTSPPLIGILGNFFCWLKGGKSVQWMMDINPDAAFAVGYLKKNSLAGKFLNWALEITLRRSSHIIVLDRYMRDIACSHGAKSENISIIHPWSIIQCDKGAQLKELTTENSIFRKKNNFGSKKLFLYSGNHSVVHPLNTILNAALKMKANSNVLFVFMGAGLRTLEVRTFKEKHQLKNIVQLQLQPREMLADALRSVDGHFVVMGQAVNGLVHTSKIYGALATGKPLIYVGPKKSHLTDLLRYNVNISVVEHSDTEGVVESIHRICELGFEEKKKISEENTHYLNTHCSMRHCLNTFEREVLKIEQLSGVLDTSSDSLSESPSESAGLPSTAG